MSCTAPQANHRLAVLSCAKPQNEKNWLSTCSVHTGKSNSAKQWTHTTEAHDLLDHLHDAMFSVENGLNRLRQSALATLVVIPWMKSCSSPSLALSVKRTGQSRQLLSGAACAVRMCHMNMSSHALQTRHRHRCRINVGVSIAEDGLRTSIGTLKEPARNKTHHA